MKQIDFKPSHGIQEPDPCPSEVSDWEFSLRDLWANWNPIWKGLAISAAVGVGISLVGFAVLYLILEGLL